MNKLLLDRLPLWLYPAEPSPQACLSPLLTGGHPCGATWLLRVPQRDATQGSTPNLGRWPTYMSQLSKTPKGLHFLETSTPSAALKRPRHPKRPDAGSFVRRAGLGGRSALFGASGFSQFLILALSSTRWFINAGSETQRMLSMLVCLIF